MAKKKSLEDYSVDELRWMLVEKRRAAREKRLERYRETGRRVIIAPDTEGSLDDLHSTMLPDEEKLAPEIGTSRRSVFRRFRTSGWIRMTLWQR